MKKENQKRKFAKEEAVRKKGNSFHNFTQAIDKYAEEELNDIIAKSQKYKYGEVTPIEVTEELINKCMLDKDYFESLDMTTKYAVKDYIKDKIVYIFSFFTLVIMPIITKAICGVFMDGMALSVLVVLMGTPAAAALPSFADQYGNDEKRASQYTFVSTILSVLTLPLVAQFLCQ